MAPCEKCGHDALPLTTKQKIEALKEGPMSKGMGEFVRKLIEVLIELEARPNWTFFSTPTVSAPTVPYVPPSIPTAPLPSVPNPWQPTYPYITCHAKPDGTVAVNNASVPDATGNSGVDLG